MSYFDGDFNPDFYFDMTDPKPQPERNIFDMLEPGDVIVSAQAIKTSLETQRARVARIRELEEALSAAQENNARLATALNAAQSELMRRESY